MLVFTVLSRFIIWCCNPITVGDKRTLLSASNNLLIYSPYKFQPPPKNLFVSLINQNKENNSGLKIHPCLRYVVLLKPA